MKISIITSVYNGAKTIGPCIQSVQNQTYHHIEHIIIDGGSTDGTE
ncbi:MAG: glycosyltransferase [bacterium]